jgi:hypothetical protein
MQATPITAAAAILFAAVTVAAYGSGTGPGTTANSGDRPAALAPEVKIVKQAVIGHADEGAPEDNGDRGGHGHGHGLGNTYCQSLKGKGGPAFGHCIAAKAHELHGHGKHR